jgi:hypothetical protein
MPTSDERLRSVEELRDLLISRARGGLIDDSRFRDLRNMVLGDPDLAARAPDWLRRTRTPDLWWAHIKPLYPTYAARTQYVHDEFEPLIEFLENPERAKTAKTHLLFRKVMIKPPESHGAGARGAPTTGIPPEPAKPEGRVFIVHGHDLTLKDAVTRFVDYLRRSSEIA